MSVIRPNMAPELHRTADLSGRIIGNWRLARRLGGGAFGTVYEAQSCTIAGRRAAVKILHPEIALRDDHKRRFINEASAASAAENENIVQIFDGGVAPDGLCYVVMELLQGASLQDRLREGRLDLARAIHIGRQVANALESAHRMGIVHRDLKPDNVFLVPQTFNPEFVKVLDFGIAKLGESAFASSVATTSGWIGTPHYMSPEQWRQVPDIDGRADIYSLGVMLFEGLTGSTPYSGENSFALMTAHLNHPVPDPGDHIPVPEAARHLIMQMMAKDRDGRPRTMAAVMEALAALDASGASIVERPRHGSSEQGRTSAPIETAAGTSAGIPARTPTETPARTPFRPRWTRTIATVMVATAVAATALAILLPRLRTGAPFAQVTSQRTQSQPAPDPRPPATAAVPPLPDELVTFGPGTFDVGWHDHRLLAGLAHQVRVGRFAISRYEVSIADYERFALATRAPGPLPWEGIDDLAPVRGLPVNLISQIEAARYCEWRYGAWRGRLPTEEEWEYAARDGLADRRYPWPGQAFNPASVNATGEPGAALLPVDGLPAGATPRGLHHMVGNVAEWTASPAPYAESGVALAFRSVVVRGGSAATSSVDGLSATARQFVAPGHRDPYIGFRCAASPL